jgi:hypothetical protein
VVAKSSRRKVSKRFIANALVRLINADSKSDWLFSTIKMSVASDLHCADKHPDGLFFIDAGTFVGTLAGVVGSMG